jgi:NAD(P)-dependent dehydrogenase (short-subunit alcohol dehydrogenase family)
MKTVLVTGGAKGVGLILSRALTQDGWHVTACGRTRQTLVEGVHAYVRADLLLAGAAKSLLRNMPLPDALICNAGNYGTLGAFVDLDFAKWRASLELNFFAVAEMVQEYVRLVHLDGNGTRRKIVIVGGAGIGGTKTVKGMSAYSCAKAALVDFVESIALEEAGVDINVLAPGAVVTGITEQARAAGLSIETKESVEARALIGKTIVRLLGPALDGLSGRLVSARWDLDRLAELEVDFEMAGPEAGMDRWRLRRIDDELFTGTD